MAIENEGLVPEEGSYTPEGAVVAPEEKPEATPGEQSTDGSANPEEGEVQKPKGVGKRIDELTRNWRESERAVVQSNAERDYWRDVASGKIPHPGGPTPGAVQSAQNQGQGQNQGGEIKTLRDFDWDEAAYYEYTQQQAREVARAATAEFLAQQNQQSAVTAQREALGAKEDEYAERQPDYFDVTRSDNAVITQPMVDVAASSENGPALLYYFAKNRDEAVKVANMPPHLAGFHIAQIAQKLSISPSRVSGAPTPAARIAATDAGLGVSPDSAASDSMSADEWAKARNKQVLSRHKN